MVRPIVHHIPVCPFSQRLEILLALKGLRDAVEFRVVDVTKPRSAELVAKTRGITALPVLETEQGVILRESLVLLRYLDERFGPRIAVADPLRHAVENLFTSLERDFVSAGHAFVLNQDRAEREHHRERMLGHYAALDASLKQYAEGEAFLYRDFGWAEAVFTPFFVRFGFLEYYEDFALPDEPRFARVRVYREACLAHASAQQVSREQVVKLYYDYAKGSGNAALLPGRKRSSFVFEPHWSTRPWPPKDKYGTSASDEELGL